MTAIDYRELQASFELLSGPRIAFRSYCLADCWPEMEAMRHPGCRFMHAVPLDDCIEAYRQAQQDIADLADAQKGVVLSLVERSSGAWLGYVLFRPDTAEDGRLWMERTLFLIPPVWGTGVAAEVEALTTAHLFCHTAIAGICHYVQPDNARSRAFLRKTGRTEEGVVPYPRRPSLNLVKFTFSRSPGER